MNEIRHSIRVLWKSPGYSLAIVFTLALGLGANTALFRFVDGLLLRPLPVHHPAELARIGINRGHGTFYAFNYPLYLDFRDQNRAFSSLAAYAEMPVNLFLNGAAERARAMLVTDNYFSMLGVKPVRGEIQAAESAQASGAGPIVSISHECWLRRFGRDPTIIGRAVSINKSTFKIAAVLPADFAGTMAGRPPEVYVPITSTRLLSAPDSRLGDPLQSRRTSWVNLLGRLKPGLSRPEAQAALRSLAATLEKTHKSPSARELVLEDGRRGHDQSVQSFRIPLLLIQGSLGLVLLMVCANLATLFLTRASARRREMAIRLALGATPFRVARQLALESGLLLAAGCAAGLILAAWLSAVFTRMPLPPGMAAGHIRWEVRDAVLVGLLTLLMAALSGWIPAWQSVRRCLVHSLKEGGPQVAGGVGTMRSALVITQLALCLVLLVSAGLCFRSLQRLQSVDLGFDAAKVLVMTLDLEQAGNNAPLGGAFIDTLLQRIRRLPGVAAASLAKTVALSGNSLAVSLQDLDGYSAKPGELVIFGIDAVTPSHFKTLGIPLLKGRDFTDQDKATAPPVAVVNEAMARRYWRGADLLGMRIRLPLMAAPPPTVGAGAGLPKTSELVEIVGVVRSGKYERVTEAPMPTLYRPLAQLSQPSVSLHVRTDGDPKRMPAAIRQEIRALDGHLPIFDVRTLAEQKSISLFLQRTLAGTLGWFGIIALAIGLAGLSSLISFGILQRTREFGIRIALGAQASDVVRLVLSQGFRLIVIGTVAGLWAAVAVTRLLSGFLFEISPTDPITFLGVPFVLGSTMLLAAYLPARRATRVDPIVALRNDG